MKREHRRRTKIVATLGPASERPERVAGLLRAGVDFVRINGSHGTHADHARMIATVREAARGHDHPVGVLFDLQGPKIRLGAFQPPRPVAAGEMISLAVGRDPDPEELPVDYARLSSDVRPGDPLLIDDGQISTEVETVEETRVTCRIRNAGTLHPRKGINLPATEVSMDALTEKDRRDALFAIEQGVDLLALSFVRRPDDLASLESFLQGHGKSVPVIAKIEKPQALDHLEEILENCWGVMVARGDLGVEMPPEQVPMEQKRIIALAAQAGRPVITATQMLESMTRSPHPTRAEASDVANAVLDGTDAVMLSGETAVGSYPVESVQMMSRILNATDRFRPPRQVELRRQRAETIPDIVADAAGQVAQDLEAAAVVAFTQSGLTAVLASRRRPSAPLLVFTPDPGVQRRLALVWGVNPHVLPAMETTDALFERLDAAVLAHSPTRVGDTVVLLMGAPIHAPGETNLMLVHRIEEPKA